MLLVACSKSNDQPTTPPPAQQPSVTVVSATVANGVMDVKVNIVKSASYNQVKLVIYKTDNTSLNYKYDVVVKDGSQIVECPHYSDASPMQYQIEYIGTSAQFSQMMTLAY